MAAGFGRWAGDVAAEETLQELHAQIGQLTREVDFLGGSRQASVAWRKAMIEPGYPLNITPQRAFLRLSRSRIDYRPVPAPCGTTDADSPAG